MLTEIAVIIMAYIMGSIPTAYIVVLLFTGKNILAYGTGNVGTMNTHRATESKMLTLLVLLGDLAKGAAAIVLTQKMLGLALTPHPAYTMAAAAAVLGHNYSLFLKFKGGKGLATAAGVFLVLNYYMIIFWVSSFVIVFLISQYLVLGQILATVALPVYAYLYHPDYFAATFAVCLLIFIRHAPRIKTLLEGKEPKRYWKLGNR